MTYKERTIINNKTATFNYNILETIEAGIELKGSEVKSLRLKNVSIKESYAKEDNEEIYLLNSQIQEYKMSNRFNHDQKRKRKLLLRKKEIKKISSTVMKKNATIVPLSMYFNKKGIIKIKLGICTGKNKIDKREIKKNEEWKKKKHLLSRYTHTAK
jgi:SsrA-binding protein